MTRVLLTAGLLAAASACVFVPVDTVTGDGVHTTRSYDLHGFTAVHNHTALRVVIHEEPLWRVSTVLDSNLQGGVSLSLDGETLNITNTYLGGMAPTGSPQVSISMPDLRAAVSSGSGLMTIDGVTGAKDLALQSSGSGGLRFSGSAYTLEAESTGSGDVTLAGAARLLVATSRGSGDIDARTLDAEAVTVVSQGSGDVFVYITGGTLSAQLSGSGDVEWWGNARSLVVSDTGSGSVRSHGGLAP